MTKREETTAEQRETIVAGLADGLRLDIAAKAAGVSPATARAWFRRGSDARDREEAGHPLDAADRVLAAFADEVETAEAAFECRLVQEVREGGPTWAKAAWLLERRFPQRWSGRVQETVAKESAELLAALKAGLDQLTYRRVQNAVAEHVEKGRRS